MLRGHTGLVATILDRVDLGHFHDGRKFSGQHCPEDSLTEVSPSLSPSRESAVPARFLQGSGSMDQPPPPPTPTPGVQMHKCSLGLPPPSPSEAHPLPAAQQPPALPLPSLGSQEQKLPLPCPLPRTHQSPGCKTLQRGDTKKKSSSYSFGLVLHPMSLWKGKAVHFFPRPSFSWLLGSSIRFGSPPPGESEDSKDCGWKGPPRAPSFTLSFCIRESRPRERKGICRISHSVRLNLQQVPNDLKR